MSSVRNSLKHTHAHRQHTSHSLPNPHSLSDITSLPHFLTPTSRSITPVTPVPIILSQLQSLPPLPAINDDQYPRTSLDLDANRLLHANTLEPTTDRQESRQKLSRDLRPTVLDHDLMAANTASSVEYPQ